MALSPDALKPEVSAPLVAKGLYIQGRETNCVVRFTAQPCCSTDTNILHVMLPPERRTGYAQTAVSFRRANEKM